MSQFQQPPQWQQPYQTPPQPKKPNKVLIWLFVGTIIAVAIVGNILVFFH